MTSVPQTLSATPTGCLETAGLADTAASWPDWIWVAKLPSLVILSSSMTTHGSRFGSFIYSFIALLNALGPTITTQLDDLLTLWSSIGCVIGVKVFTQHHWANALSSIFILQHHLHCKDVLPLNLYYHLVFSTHLLSCLSLLFNSSSAFFFSHILCSACYV